MGFLNKPALFTPKLQKMDPLFIFFTEWLSKTNIFKRQEQYLKQNVFRKRIKSIGLFKLLSANPTKWSNTFKQFVGNSLQIV